jgi:hypothetical protein
MRNDFVRIAVYILAPTVCAMLAAGFVFAVKRKGFWSSDTASWLQAFGSIVGIALAIYVPYKQKKDADQAERDRRVEAARRMCGALKDELVIMAESFNGDLFQKLLEDEPDKGFYYQLPSPGPLHPVYSALLNRIVDIDDSETRQAVIKVYGAETHLHEMLALNTEYLHRYKEIHANNVRGWKPAGNVEAALKEVDAQARFISLRSQLRESATILVERNKHAVACLERVMGGGAI